MNRITETSISRNQEKVQKEININILWLWKISYYRHRHIRKSYRSMTTTKQWSRMKTADCVLCMKTNINETTLQHSWQRNVSNHQSIRTMKSISARSKTSDNHQVRSQKSAILHDNEEVEQMINTMSRNFSRIWFHHSILQKKRQ